MIVRTQLFNDGSVDPQNYSQSPSLSDSLKNFLLQKFITIFIMVPAGSMLVSKKVTIVRHSPESLL